MYKLEVFICNNFWYAMRNSNDLYLLLHHCRYLSKLHPEYHFRVIKLIEIV